MNLTDKYVGARVGTLVRDLMDFLDNRTSCITEAEITSGSTEYKKISSQVITGFSELRKKAGDDKVMLNFINDLDDSITAMEVAERDYFYKAGFQDAIKTVFQILTA